MRIASFLVVWLVASVCWTAAAAADSDIAFELPSLADCAPVTNQYAGVRFVTAAPENIGSLAMPSALVVNAAAHSPAHVLVNGSCSDEFPWPQEVFQLTQTRAAVSAYVRVPDGPGTAVPVQLRAYDAGGARIDTNGATFTALARGTGPWTQISAATADNTNRIATVALVTQNATLFQGVRIWMDDIHLADGPVAAPPDFTLGPPTPLTIQQNARGSVTVPINRLNGSTGPVSLATSGIPTGMGASAFPVDPNAVVDVYAGLDTPPGDQHFTLTATPTSSAAGSLPRSISVPVVVLPTLPRITISEPAEETLLDRVPYGFVARGTFTSPRGGGHVCTVVTHTAETPPPPPPDVCTGVVAGGSGSWADGATGFTPGVNYITAFIRDDSGYVGSATRLLRIADETTGVDLRITGVQITQDVQETTTGLLVPSAAGSVAYRGVQLVQGKPIYVRVFANTNRAARSDGRTPQVAGRLRVLSRGSEVPFSPFMPLPGTRDLAVGPNLYASYAEMSTFDTGYRYTLSSSLTTAGPLTLEATINDGLNTPIIECSVCRSNDTLRITDLRFRPEHTRDIYPMEFHDSLAGARRVAGTPSQIFALAQQVYPFPVAVHPWVARVDITDALREAARDIESHPDDRAENWVTHFPGDYERDHNPNGPVIAVAAPGSYPGGMETSSFFCCDPPRIDPFAVTLESRPLTSVAHEFGHTEGLAHADHACRGGSDGQHADDGWPDTRGTVIGIGFDGPGRRVLPAYDVTGPGPSVAANYDFMSYCAGEGTAWISTRNWNTLVDREAAGAASRAASTRAEPPRGPSGPGLAVSVVLPLAGTGGAVTSVQPVSGGSQGSDAGGDTTLVVLGAGGAPISSTAVESTLVHSDRPGAPPQLQVNAVIPADGDPRALQVQRDGAIVASRSASAHAPTVRLLAPRRGARVGASLRVRWRATDADHDHLTFAVDEATGPRAPFRMVTAGLAGSTVTVPLSLLTPSANARIRVRALDGFRQGTAVVTGVRIPVAAPAVVIGSPARMTTTVRADDIVALEGQAFDAHSRRISGGALTWRLDGRRVATGSNAMIGELAPGRHALTLSAVREGKRGIASRRLVVTKVTPRLLTATTTAVGRRARRATLTLAASVRCRVRITGGAKPVTATIDRRAVRVAVPVKPGSRTLTFRLALRGGGGAATARFSVARG